MKQKKTKVAKKAARGKVKPLIVSIPSDLKVTIPKLPENQLDYNTHKHLAGNGPVTKETVQAMIKQAIVLWNNRFYSGAITTDPTELLSRKTGELFQSLLFKQQKSDDWGAAMLEYNFFFVDLLTLLAKPGVLEMLPEHRQKEAASMLSNLQSFFACVDYDDTRAFMDYHYCETASAGELKYMLEHYDFTKRYDNERGNHFFSDVASGKKQDEILQGYYNEHFKK